MSTQISAQMVKELREKTGAGMMVCKKALQDAEGDMKAAEIKIAEAGQRKVAKSASRTAAEGAIFLATNEDKSKAALVEINSETDFVARDAGFNTFGQQVADCVLNNGVVEVTMLKDKALSADNDATIEAAREALVAKIGENIQFRRAAFKEMGSDGHIGAYIHGARIGALVVLQGGNATLAKDIAMHVAATKPEAIMPEDISPARIEEEKGIFKAQALKSGKPEAIVEKMIDGRMKKFVNEICLVGQPFVKNPDQSIAQLLSENSAKVIDMVRFEVGEGIEVEDKPSFAEEVAAQVRSGD